MDSITIYLEKNLSDKRKERLKKAEKANLLIVGTTLVINGFDGISQSAGTFNTIAYLNLLTGIMHFLAAKYISILKQKAGEINFVRWLNVLAAIVIFVDGVDKLFQGKKYLPFAYFFISIIYGILALLFPTLQKRFFMKINQGGIIARVSLFKKIELVWKDITFIDVNESTIKISVHNNENYEFVLNNTHQENQDIFKYKLREYAESNEVQIE